MNPCSMLQRVRDEAHFEQVDFVQLAAFCRAAIAARAEAEAEAVDRAAAEKRGCLTGGIVERGDDAQSARVFLRSFDPADPLLGPVLPVERQRFRAFAQRPGKGTGPDRVARGVGTVEQRGIACEAQSPLP